MNQKNKTYWLSFGDKNASTASEQQQANEFQEKLPQDHNNKRDTDPSRRDFLKLMGFTTAAAVLASCDKPARKAISYMARPNQEVSGVADFFASTYRQNAEVIPILVKVREGRPIKIEGNKSSSLLKGATSARLQASVLDLYNTARLKFPTKDKKEIPTLAKADQEIVTKLNGINPSQITLVTSSVSSPTSAKAINLFKSKYKGAKHIQSDAISYTAMLKANKQSYGRDYIPFYQFDKAKTIVSFSADFLGTWLLPTAFASQYAQRRKVNKEENEMSHHIHFESVMTLTGSNADKRYTHNSALSSTLLYDLLSLLKGRSDLLTSQDSLRKALKATAKKLLANRSEALVVSGSNLLEDQLVVNEINQILQSNGNTINWAMPLPTVQSMDEDIDQLIVDLKNGNTKAVIFADCNPVYTHAKGELLQKALTKASLTVGLDTFANETLNACTYNIPSNHYLESWNDDQVVGNYFSFTQPAIVNLFKTRQWQESLLKWSGSSDTYVDIIEKYWVNRLGSRVKWKEVQQLGIFENTSGRLGVPSFSRHTFDSKQFKPTSAKTTLIIYQKVGIGEGNQAGNPWLQEMPDPISKATWGNYVMISYARAKELLGIDLNSSRDADAYEVDVDKPVVRVKSGKIVTELPVLITPGVADDTIAIAMGYGRSADLGIAAKDLGESVSTFLTSVGGSTQYVNANITLEKTDETSPVAITQSHHSYEGRTEVVKETTMAAFIAEPNFFSKAKDKLVEDYAPKTGNFAKEGTLYDEHEQAPIHWGMSVDLNSCIGCGACVVACNAENNVAVVGKEEVLRGHEMHWMRIDRYFSGSPEQPEVIHQPMMCQHCDNAPCENVCPVAATSHSSEGLNQMSYNRCVGTRYCANNCPYKVRRFNWADYLGADAVENNQKEVLTDVAMDMNDDLTRMVLNPDVTVRSRGVMEKCSFCAQRLIASKLKAKKENRPLGDEVETACMQSCPTEAIVFGNVKDEKSRVKKAKDNERTYGVLQQIHTLPNVTYLGKVRNV